ncbi:FG-GAP-like repeat-containing protein [Paenibacillus assamensis]|uniref:FG-GAP-like repeat-containing protein n=1 Tax=Paenibacillus assamensis TaxID=311244 RepID=UPI0004006FCD|nr:FG-GAP-like repeat-containing protein [Paenibacillus assamensis]
MQRKWLISARRYLAAVLVVFMFISLFPMSFIAADATVIETKKDSNYSDWRTLKLNERARSQVAGNLDNTGNADLAVITEDNFLVLYYVSSDGTLTRRPVTAKLADPNLERVQITDLNGDQFGEVIAFSKSKIEIFSRDADGSYGLKSTIPIGAYSDQAIVDFNKDGTKDLIVASSTKLHFLQGSANLAYQEVGTYTHKTDARYGQVTIETGDWNNDGHLDFVYQLYGQQAVLFKGNGELGFSYLKEISIHSFVTDDVNQDGFTDLIGYNRGNYHYRYEVYYGDMNGQFTQKSSVEFVDGYFEIFSTDVNKDGYPDLVLYDSTDYYTYILWNRNGKYSMPEQSRLFVYSNHTYQLLDFDRDGRDDFVSNQNYYTHEIVVIRNNGVSGQIQFSQKEQTIEAHQQSVQVQVERTGGSAVHSIIEYATQDGTAKAGTDYTKTSGVLEFNNGETVKSLTVPIISVNRFQGARTFSIRLKNPTNGTNFGQNQTINIHIRANETVPHWRNGAVVDIADVTSSSVTIVWPQAQDSKGIQSYEISEKDQSLAPVSVTKDVYSYTWNTGLVPGKTYHFQVTAKNEHGKVSQALRGHITIPVSNNIQNEPSYRWNPVRFGLFSRGYKMNAVDSNGDGSDELVVYDQWSTMMVKLNSDQSWLFHGRLPLGQGGENSYRADFNRNGKEEWIAPSIGIVAEGSMQAYEKVASIPSYTDYKIVDFTKEGIQDIVYISGGTLGILKGNGDYTFTRVFEQSLYLNGVQVLTGDWNGDGKMDVAVFDGNLHVYKNNGNRFEKIKEIHNPTTPQAADFNGDGYDDIVTSHWGSDVFVYYGDAQGSFDNTPYRYTPPYGVYEIHLADLNNDSNKDFVLVYFSGVEAVVNQGKGSFQPQGVFNEMMWFSSRYLMGDFNGDGKDDIGYRREDYSGFELYDNRLTSGSLQFSNASQHVQETAEFVQVKVKRVGDRHGVTSVVYGTEDGTALAGVDYAASTGTLTFADGETEKTVKIPLIKNGTSNVNRKFKVKLQSPTRGAKLGQYHQLEVNLSKDVNLAPTWPVGAKLTVSDVTYRSFTISWPNAIDLDGIASYEIIERDGALAPVTVAGNVNTYTWSSGLTSGKSYRLQVRAKDKKGLTSWPLQSCVTVQACVKLPKPLHSTEPIDVPIQLPSELPIEPPLIDLPYVLPQWLGDERLTLAVRRGTR